MCTQFLFVKLFSIFNLDYHTCIFKSIFKRNFVVSMYCGIWEEETKNKNNVVEEKRNIYGNTSVESMQYVLKKYIFLFVAFVFPFMFFTYQYYKASIFFFQFLVIISFYLSIITNVKTGFTIIFSDMIHFVYKIRMTGMLVPILTFFQNIFFFMKKIISLSVYYHRHIIWTESLFLWIFQHFTHNVLGLGW